ncbi:glycosyltransferase [Asticcacaulis excentricus]|uniref:Glycosyl transferase family 2 n=1 Tax=Asticcacaulis excentricus (strain ATCC 15261 / DSM 4724 / KCTC 12464 / NCIMB 9791 / VKM B-1370 / CB 48) TaxID=573065 RepID=E8RMP7_ASTEC|nr:glycosyltransferase [Asticcacaulis excentricus]ADU13928.1 glycosyl transferase family 2 [Asticcacaulis excentricus CB 48]
MKLKLVDEGVLVYGLPKNCAVTVFLNKDRDRFYQLDDVLGGKCYVKLPEWFFDTAEHRAEIEVNSSRGRETQTLIHRSKYVCELNDIGRSLFGWIYDATRPATKIKLSVDLDGKAIYHLIAEGESVFAPEGYSNFAFGFDNPVAEWDRSAHILGLRVSGTQFYPFGEYLVNLTPESILHSDVDGFKSSRLSESIQQCLKEHNLRQARCRRLGQNLPSLPNIWQICLPNLNYPITSAVNVIIPVYRGIEETINCINSVLAANNATPVILSVINDCSPEQELTLLLREHSAQNGYQYLENPENLGFVSTVNRGMQLHQDSDVVLLNADTVVSDGWLDRMRGAAYREPRVGSVSAMSNNATICSVPYIGGREEIPYGLTLSQVNELLGRENSGVSVQLPTAHGFCMYISRACLRQVGLFDAEKFGKGYGEENEFSLRSATKGWKHVVACDVFVYHCGSVSFKESAEGFIANNLKVIASEYPDYDYNVHQFLSSDPLLLARNRLLTSQWRQKRVAVLLSLAIGGGVDENLNYTAAKLASEGVTVLIAKRTKKDFYLFEMNEWGADHGTLYNSVNGVEALLADIYAINPIFVHVHHVLDMSASVPEFLIGAGIPYFVTLHDYFYICPRVTLLNDGGQFCEIPPVTGCNRCIARGGIHSAIDSSYQKISADVDAWRKYWVNFLSGARAVIIPNESAKIYYAQLFEDLPYRTLSHLGPKAPSVKSEPAALRSDEIVVAVIGAIGPHKGSEKLVELLRWSQDRSLAVSYKLIGYSDRNELLERFDNFENIGPYKGVELGDKIRASGATVALFLSPWPETYSYTLSEAFLHGLTPVAVDLGALGNRIGGIGVGQLVNANAHPQEIIEAIEAAALVRVIPKTYDEGQYISLLHDYYDFLDPVDESRPAIRLEAAEAKPGEGGVYLDGWCGKEVSLHLSATSHTSKFHLGLYVPEGRLMNHVDIFEGEVFLSREAILPGQLNDLDIDLPIRFGYRNIYLKFDVVEKNDHPDVRMTTSLLVKASIS